MASSMSTSSKLKLDADEAEAMNKQLAALTADQRADQLQRLERSLLRLERINVQTLALLQKLVGPSSARATKAASDISPDPGRGVRPRDVRRRRTPQLHEDGAHPARLCRAPAADSGAAGAHRPALRRSMSDQLFEDLRLPRPDINLEVGSGSACGADRRGDEALRAGARRAPAQPACWWWATSTPPWPARWWRSRRAVPVVHVEAGLRSYDRRMPEEINRVLTDQISDRLYTTERSALDNLQREGIADSRVLSPAT
jgi:hypothetical protein